MAHLTINDNRFELTVPDLDNDALRAALDPIIASFREQGGVWLNTNVEDAGVRRCAGSPPVPASSRRSTARNFRPI